MKLVMTSDTHDQHLALKGALPDGDVFIHAGDFTGMGEPSCVEKFNEWLGTLPHKYKLVIPGNHELTFEPGLPTYDSDVAALLTNATLLNDSSAVIDGVKFWGSPVTPYFCNWAFNRVRGAEIKEHWDLIPNDTDVLITHGPPMNILDELLYNGEHVGCEELLKAIERVKPKVHVFGHIHAGHGVIAHDGTTFVNASFVNERYRPAYAPEVIDI
jgi:Icc-related predicted phosphoesterase